MDSNDEEALDVDVRNYSKALSKLGISKFLSASAEERDRLTEDEILNTVFYSSVIEGNRLDTDAAKLLINGGFVELQGRLPDYIELLNHKKLYEYIAAMKNSSISYSEVIRVHDLLFEGIIGSHNGPRNAISTVGSYIAETPENIKDGVERSLQFLNRQADSQTETFLEALNFHIKFVSVHPFEDGNGRVTRLFFNRHLIKDGMHPLCISNTDKPLYFDSLAAFHSSGYMQGFVASMLYFYTRNNEREIADMLKAGREGYANDPFSLAIADSMLISSKSIDDAALNADMRFLYSSDKAESKQAALWLMSQAGNTDRELIGKALEDKNPKVRAMGLFAVEMLFCRRSRNGLDSYYGILRKLALEDNDYVIRSEALYMMGRRGKPYLDTELIEKIAKEDGVMLLPLFNAVKNTTENVDAVELIAPFLNDNRRDVRLLAYQAMAMSAPSRDIPKILDKIDTLDFETKASVIRRLSALDYSTKESKLNSKHVAEWISKVAEGDSEVRDILLYALSLCSRVNGTYAPWLEKVAAGMMSDKNERAYAIYALSRVDEAGQLNRKYDMSISTDNTLSENIAIFLSGDRGIDRKAERLFDINSKELHLAGEAELKKAMEENIFGIYFLSLCRENLERWR